MKAKKKEEKMRIGCILGLIGVLLQVVLFIYLIYTFIYPLRFTAYSWSWAYIIVTAILMFIGILEVFAQQKISGKKALDSFEKAGIDLNKYYKAGKYISGHPKMDNPQQNCNLYIRDNTIKIYIGTRCLGNIEIDKIKNIAMEDETSIQTRVGIKRMLAIGIFAFAVKKKVKEELAYLIIEWNDDRFDHETVFEFEGVGSVSSVNKLRNKLINQIKN